MVTLSVWLNINCMNTSCVGIVVSYLHGAELNSPSDIWIWRRWFEPHCLPVSWLEILGERWDFNTTKMPNNSTYNLSLFASCHSEVSPCFTIIVFNVSPQNDQTRFHHQGEFSPQRVTADPGWKDALYAVPAVCQSLQTQDSDHISN